MSDKTYKCPSTFDGKPCPGASAPHYRGMCVLAGVNELRDAVQWANNTPEIEHDHLTAEEILARFRAARDGHESGPITADNITDEQLARVRDDETCQLDERVTAAAAMTPDLPRSHGMKTRCRAKIAALLNARQAAKP